MQRALWPYTASHPCVRLIPGANGAESMHVPAQKSWQVAQDTWAIITKEPCSRHILTRA